MANNAYLNEIGIPYPHKSTLGIFVLSVFWAEQLGIIGVG